MEYSLTDLGKTLCFQAMNKEQVDQVYQMLLTGKANIIRGPQLMSYSKNYYTVDFYDPDGQIIEVAHTPFADLEFSGFELQRSGDRSTLQPAVRIVKPLTN